MVYQKKVFDHDYNKPLLYLNYLMCMLIFSVVYQDSCNFRYLRKWCLISTFTLNFQWRKKVDF